MRKAAMRRSLFAFTTVISAAFAPTAFGSATDSGIVKAFFAGPSGMVAIQLDNGFPNAKAGGVCASSPGLWAGSTAADPILKSAMLAAKTSGAHVSVTLNGCDSSGLWHKVENIFIN